MQCLQTNVCANEDVASTTVLDCSQIVLNSSKTRWAMTLKKRLMHKVLMPGLHMGL